MSMIEKRPVGMSGLKVAPLALGGNVFGWTADEATSFRILDAFVDAGGTMIDTADVYSAWVPGHKGGESEEVIGRWLKRDPGKRKKVVIATKVGFMAGLKPDTIGPSCDASLQRLGIETIDIYYQHKDDESVPLAEACIIARVDGFPAVSALQPWYNMLEREKYEEALRAVAEKENLAVFPYYSLANGFLTGKYRVREDLDKSPRGLRNISYLEGKGPRVLAALDEVAAETGAALASVALAWTMAQPTITAPIASATSLEQVNELIAGMRLELTQGQLERLSEASRSLADA